ncbi:MAG TPA: NlpC/P60 family protein [Acidimicrobiales bacterium]|nr:NlpC/P60 family protein [Acidimicrobiales bacterium]
MAHIEQILSLMISQSGDPYIFGARVSRTDPDPPAFDCSELIEWACKRAGVQMPDGSKNQKRFCVDEGGLGIPVPEAIDTRGALLFRMTGEPTHVVASLGNGETIEARGSKYGVGEFQVRNREWTHGARIPGVDYSGPVPNVGPSALGVVRRALVPGRGIGPDGRFPMWKVLTDGSVHALGQDAPFHGALPSGEGGLGIQVNDVVDILPNGDGGYWLAAADGAVFSFGQAVFWGSLPGIKVRPAAPVKEIQRRPDGREGYVLVAEDDATFTFPVEGSHR